ncbi:tumor necrosis factor alpha-induced protein 2-like [Oreochromis aureus]|uniref:Exocyst complex component Sec6 n=1 Tax=Oreochromis aureus TaxID=47969 RepID=A0AAZ1XUQ2_OREAU|nr:tumor necrosis factor alpha-induced protein 2-like [Oreochromis aureus]
MMDKSTENLSKKNSMIEKLRRSLRRQTRKNPPSPGGEESNVLRKLHTTAKNSDSAASPQPPSPSLNDGSASTSPNNNQKKEDDESDVSSHKSRTLTRSNTDPTTSTVKRMKESFYFKWKKSEDKATSIEEKVTPTFEEYLERQYLFEATQLLIDREKDLFREITEADAMKDHEEAVKKLAADYEALEKRIEQTVQQSLSLSSEEEVSALISAVKAINLEEEQDQLRKQRCQTPPAWRPKKWKEHHDKVLHELVYSRLENPSSPTGDQENQSSIQADIQSMGKQLKEDLQWVVEVVKNCYPPEMDICNFYARQYHQTFSARLKKIADFVLDDKDCSFLLRWVKEFYPGILEKPELASNINTEALGNLLPDELLKPLEEQYLSKQQSDLMIYIDRVLDEAKKEWDQGKEPTRDDGCYVSPVAYDVIQFINGIVTSAHITVRDPHKAQKITSNLTDFMQRYKEFHEDILRQNKPHSKAFIKANLSCVKQFRDFLVEHDLFPENVREKCLQVLTEMKQSAHTYLLTPVHKILKPHYQKVGTSDWLKKNTFKKLLNSTEEELRELQGSSQSSYQELIGQLYQEVAEEYVRRLLKGKIKLKNNKKQKKAYETVKGNAEKLHELFAKMGSKQDWLKEILTKIAEVLRLQDIPAIQMQIVSLGSAYPDLSEEHVSALLKLKTNLSNADMNTITSTVLDILRESYTGGETRMFFSNVKVMSPSFPSCITSCRG